MADEAKVAEKLKKQIEAQAEDMDLSLKGIKSVTTGSGDLHTQAVAIQVEDPSGRIGSADIAPDAVVQGQTYEEAASTVLEKAKKSIK